MTIVSTVTPLLEQHALRYSPMVRLEMEYLHEISRIKYASSEMTARLHAALNIAESETRFNDVCAFACRIGWTRDAFDRLIVAEADFHRARLVTADNSILTHYKRAVW